MLPIDIPIQSYDLRWTDWAISIWGELTELVEDSHLISPHWIVEAISFDVNKLNRFKDITEHNLIELDDRRAGCGASFGIFEKSNCTRFESMGDSKDCLCLQKRQHLFHHFDEQKTLRDMINNWATDRTDHEKSFERSKTLSMYPLEEEVNGTQ
jgi:hypothetical protein